jgi:hypothetical protein
LPKVTFLRDFDWSPEKFSGRVTLAFKAGTETMVTRDCAAKAKKAGAIESDESR